MFLRPHNMQVMENFGDYSNSFFWTLCWFLLFQTGNCQKMFTRYKRQGWTLCFVYKRLREYSLWRKTFCPIFSCFENYFLGKQVPSKMRKVTSLTEVGKTSSTSGIPHWLCPLHDSTPSNTPHLHPIPSPPPIVFVLDYIQLLFG